MVFEDQGRDRRGPDRLILFAAAAIKLRRGVEMYQWLEHEETTTEKKVGGGEERRTTYTCSRGWSGAAVKSSRFKEPAGHANPGRLPCGGISHDVLRAQPRDEAGLGARRRRPVPGQPRGHGLGALAFLIPGALSLATIAAAWIFYRPLLAAALLAGAAALGVLGWTRLGRSRPQDAPQPV